MNKYCPSILAILVLIMCIPLDAYSQDSVSKVVEDNQSFESRFSADELNAAPIKLIPYPQEVKWGQETIAIKSIKINTSQISELIQKELKENSFKGKLPESTTANYTINFATDSSLSEEAYTLDIDSKGIHITSSTETGEYYALQTLRQLITFKEQKAVITTVKIKDRPAFPIRGYMIDVGRNFQSMRSLKEQIDLMAQYKMNIFHWHLTDRPAWRIESKRYPELIAAENHRITRNPGKYYTYDEIRELILYAKERKITVLPEIDMPGHSDSFRKSMGCRMESKEGMEILENVLHEFFEEIPKKLAPMIHIGSDEVHIDNKEEFISKMVSVVEDNDRKVIIWSPGLEAKNSVIRQTWGSADAVQGDFLEIDSRKSYMNAAEPMSFINTLFFKPIGAYSNNKTIGGIICLWPDVNVENEEDPFVQNPFYQSLLTYAWTTWTRDVLSAPSKYMLAVPPKGTEAGNYFKAFETYLLAHKQRYFSSESFPYEYQSDKHWKLIGPFKGNDGDALVKNNTNSGVNYEGKQLDWIPAVGNTLVIKHRWMRTGYFPQANAGDVVYAQTFIHSETEKDVPVWINFETPMRANRVYGGIPKNGEWDAHGGSIYINDKKLQGPNWNKPGWKSKKQTGWGTKEEQEIPWTKEELYWTRKPAKIHLIKGWNKVLVKIPSTSDFQNWMFTFVPLNMKGIHFSPDKNDIFE